MDRPISSLVLSSVEGLSPALSLAEGHALGSLVLSEAEGNEKATRVILVAFSHLSSPWLA